MVYAGKGVCIQRLIYEDFRYVYSLELLGKRYILENEFVEGIQEFIGVVFKFLFLEVYKYVVRVFRRVKRKWEGINNYCEVGIRFFVGLKRFFFVQGVLLFSGVEGYESLFF